MEAGEGTLVTIFFCVFSAFFLPENEGTQEGKKGAVKTVYAT